MKIEYRYTGKRVSIEIGGPGPSERWRFFVTIEDPLPECLALHGAVLNRSYFQPKKMS